ncbi:hypothetical protein M0G74_01005 [Microbulbifer sp. CAU 1566]|uniref:O-antigen ligase family protein n=1 Tax=Microbulbifer sp. CAU 1566 TaxID=2933269 RepID=UPI00200557DA|nr:hypothetical protein [Microbulbifer sp. CAU 1566]MCK7595843.1 hypothetical protein [Microbulbifer sp. CAU 1566]
MSKIISGDLKLYLSEGSLSGWFFLILLCIWFFISVVPVNIPNTGDLYNFKRLLQVALVCLICVYAYCLMVVAPPVIAPAVDAYYYSLALLFLAFVFLLFAGSFFSTHPIQSAMEASHFVLLFSVFLSGVYLSRANLSQKLLLFFMFCYLSLILRALIYLYLEIVESGVIRPSVFYPTVTSVRFFNQIQVFFIPLLAAFLCHRRFSLGAAGLLFVSLFLAISGGARGLLVSIVAAGLLSFILLPAMRQTLARSAIVLVFAFLCYELVTWNIVVGDDPGETSPFRMHTSGRSAIWLELTAAITPMHSLLGAGTGAYAFTEFSRVEGHPHNSLLQFLFEWGGLATAIFIGLLWFIFYRGVKYIKCSQLRGQNIEYEAALLITILSSAIYSLFSGIFVMPIPQTLFFLYLGLLWAKISPISQLDYGKFALFFKGLVGLFLLIVLVYYAWVVADFYQQQSTITGFRGPRFWGNGAPLE